MSNFHDNFLNWYKFRHLFLLDSLGNQNKNIAVQAQHMNWVNLLLSKMLKEIESCFFTFDAPRSRELSNDSREHL